VDVFFHSETRFLAINGYPAEKRYVSISFLFVPFEKKENFECASHTKSRKSREKKNGVTG
jgi:hypothetical protein